MAEWPNWWNVGKEVFNHFFIIPLRGDNPTIGKVALDDRRFRELNSLFNKKPPPEGLEILEKLHVELLKICEELGQKVVFSGVDLSRFEIRSPSEKTEECIGTPSEKQGKCGGLLCGTGCCYCECCAREG